MSKQTLFCRHCKKERLISDYYESSPTMCKDCIKTKYGGYKKEYYIKNREKILEYRREWYKKNPDKIKKYAKKHYKIRTEYYRNWYKVNGRKRAKDYVEYTSLWRRKNIMAVRASLLARHAVKWGFLKKPKCCEACKEGRKTIGHHKDYMKPLEVKWLCYSCHAKLNFKK